jgi:hypothetical protein
MITITNNPEDGVSYELLRSKTITGHLLLPEPNRYESNPPSPTMVMTGDLPLSHTIKLLHRTTMMTAVIGVSPPPLPDLSVTVMVMGTETSTLLFLLDLNIDPLPGTMMKRISKMMGISLLPQAILCMELMCLGQV